MLISLGISMTDIPIKEFLAKHTQIEAAEIMGVTQGAVSQAHLSGREIYFRPADKGGFTYYEIKKPRQKKAA